MQQREHGTAVYVVFQGQAPSACILGWVLDLLAPADFGRGGRTCCWLLGNGYADDDGGGAAACTLARQHPNNMRIRALKSTEAGSYSAEERKCACWCFSAAGLDVRESLLGARE